MRLSPRTGCCHPETSRLGLLIGPTVPKRRQQARQPILRGRPGRLEAKADLRARSTILVREKSKAVSSPPESVLLRKPASVVIGVADIGGLHWCEQKATFSQQRTELGYIGRALQIIEADHPPPSFLRPDSTVVAIEAFPPRRGEPPETLRNDIPEWMRAQIDETRDSWKVALVAVFHSRDLGIDADLPVILVGVTDGVIDDGTVLEVRQSLWEWEAVKRNRVTSEKETQANIYATLLGALGWRCVFSCRDGRHITQGPNNQRKTFEDIQKGALLRIGLLEPIGVESSQAWRCEGGRCEFAHECTVTPLWNGEE